MAQATDRFGETFGTVPYTRVGRRVPCQGSSPARPRGIFVESFFVSSIVVSLAEIGDNTQILSMTLASRFLNTRFQTRRTKIGKASTIGSPERHMLTGRNVKLNKL
jgi:Uncharacterized protein family UPF0016